MLRTTRRVIEQKCERSGRYFFERLQNRCSDASIGEASIIWCHASGTVPGSVKTHITYEARRRKTSTWKMPMHIVDSIVVCGHTTGQSTYGP